MGEISGFIKEKGGQVRAAIDEKLGDKKGAALGKKDQLEGELEKNISKIKKNLKP